MDSVIKSFGRNQVLTDIYLSCRRGEIIGLLGRNGCGKSTLLKIIFGSLAANQKYVKVDGKSIHSLWDRNHLISYLPQHNFLPDHIRIKTLINFLCNEKAKKQLLTNRLIVKTLKLKGRQLSGGEKRALEILITIYSDAKYILLDEPFNGIAPVYIDNIKQTIRQESASKGFILTDHDYHNILNTCNRLLYMHDGGTRNIHSISDLEQWGYVPPIKGV